MEAASVNWRPHVGRWFLAAVVFGDLGTPMANIFLPDAQNCIRNKRNNSGNAFIL